MKTLFQLIGIVLQISFAVAFLVTSLLTLASFIGMVLDLVKHRSNKKYKLPKNWSGIFIRSLIALFAVFVLYFVISFAFNTLLPCEWGGICFNFLSSHY
jgi:hypothetical protein